MDISTSRLWKLEVRDQGAAWSGEGPVLLSSQFLTVTSLGKEGRELAGASFIRTLIPYMKAPPSRFKHRLKAPPPTIIIFRGWNFKLQTGEAQAFRP